jgi:hypothetical protein
MPGWLRRGAYAAQLAADRADLWPAGALAWLAYLGWIPLPLVVAGPDPNDLAFLGVSLYSSSAFPANVIALAAAVVGGFAILCLAAGVAQVALLGSGAVAETRRTPFARASLTAFTIILLSSLPAVGAIGALLLGVLAVAPTEFTSPDIGTPILLRLAGELWPFIAVLVLALVASQAFGGVALRQVQLGTHVPVTSILAASGRDVLARPLSRLRVATVGLLLDAAALLMTLFLLRVLWAPIGAALDAGRLGSPDTLVLLLGFVAIWLALLLAAGAVHVAVSAWWAIELARNGRRQGAAGIATRADRAAPMGSDTGGAQ